jgi:hypothetical protein
LRRARHQPRKPRAGVLAQRQHPRMALPLGDAFAQQGWQLFQQRLEVGRRAAAALGAGAALALAARRPQQRIELLRHQFPVGVELVQEGAAIGETHGPGDPAQVIVAAHEHVGLLIVQELDAVFHAAQEFVGPGQRVGRGLRHQARRRDALQRLQGRTRAQFGVLAAAHHLQQLHGEFDLADAAARQLDVVGAFRPARAALGRVFADLLVQQPQ